MVSPGTTEKGSDFSNSFNSAFKVSFASAGTEHQKPRWNSHSSTKAAPVSPGISSPGVSPMKGSSFMGGRTFASALRGNSSVSSFDDSRTPPTTPMTPSSTTTPKKMRTEGPKPLRSRRDLDMTTQRFEAKAYKKELLIRVNYSDYQETLTTARNHRTFLFSLLGEVFRYRKALINPTRNSGDDGSRTPSLRSPLSASTLSASTLSSGSGRSATRPGGSAFAAVRLNRRARNAAQSSVRSNNTNQSDGDLREAQLLQELNQLRQHIVVSYNRMTTEAAADPYRELLSDIHSNKYFSSLPSVEEDEENEQDSSAAVVFSSSPPPVSPTSPFLRNLVRQQSTPQQTSSFFDE